MKWCIIFNNSYGKFACIIEAETSKEAIEKALKYDSIREFNYIEAVQIIL